MRQQLLRLKDALKVTYPGRMLMKICRDLPGRSRKAAFRAIRRFGRGELPPETREKMAEDMLHCSKKYNFNFEDYFQLDLWNKTEEERRGFISDSERVTICEGLNRAENQKIFDDKEKTAEVFGKYYRRETLGFRTSKDLEKVEAFLKKHGTVIVKPLSSASGKGIRLVPAGEEVEKTAKKLIRLYCTGLSSGGILEELVSQDERMGKPHPQSVNTVRIPTIRLDDRVVIFHPYYRVGRKDSVVDNAGAGGIICAVDAETGVVVAAADEMGLKYTAHPETGEQLVGFRIPRWQEAVSLAEKLANVVPSNRYTGWDLALTEDGWILIEANARGQFVCQIPLQQGFREEIEGYKKELSGK